MIRKAAVVAGALALVVALGAFAVGAVGAQTGAPARSGTAPAGSAPAGVPAVLPGGGGPDFLGGSIAAFDAQAKALNLTPVQLFEQLHSGKALSEIAQAQGVDLATVQEAVKGVQLQSTKDLIAQAVKDGSMGQAQADWFLEGLAKGYMDGGPGFGPMGGGRMMGGMGPGPRGAPGAPPSEAPANTPQ